MAGSPLLPPSLENFLQLTSAREQVVSGNMANVDTPGYRTRDINFHQTLMTASGTDGEMQLTPVVSKVGGLLERPDGNNVDLDRESMLLAQSQLQYQMGIQLVKSNFHELLSAINGGGNS
jgi:flagellar basal-body rod protein FlgB